MAHNIVLKDTQGKDVTYNNVSEINLVDTNGNEVVFNEQKPTQTKTINPTTSEQTARADDGYELTEVKVGAIQTEEMTATQNGEYTPSNGKYINKFTVNVASSGGGGYPIEVSTDNDMTNALVEDNLGKVYKFTGTSDTYDNNAIYIIEEI